MRTKNTDIPLEKAYVICTTRRSGSNLLMFTLRQQGLGLPAEYFNHKNPTNQQYFHQQVIKTPPTTDFLDNDENLTKLQQHLQRKFRSPNGVFGTKLFPSDLYHRTERFRLFQQNMHPKTKYILLNRKNLIEKAVSLHFAVETQQWMQRSTEQSSDSTVRYNYERIQYFLEHLKEAQRFWDTIWQDNPYPLLRLEYDELVNNFHHTMKRINTFLGHEGLPIPEPPIQKQVHPLKKSFEKLFVSEYKQRHRTR